MCEREIGVCKVQRERARECFWEREREIGVCKAHRERECVREREREIVWRV